MTENIREKVEKAIQEIRPNLQADGGDIELVDVAGGVAKVKLKGSMRWLSNVNNDSKARS